MVTMRLAGSNTPESVTENESLRVLHTLWSTHPEDWRVGKDGKEYTGDEWLDMHPAYGPALAPYWTALARFIAPLVALNICRGPEERGDGYFVGMSETQAALALAFGVDGWEIRSVMWGLVRSGLNPDRHLS